MMSTLPSLENAFLRYAGLRGQLSCGLLASASNLQRLSLSGNKEVVGELPGCFLQVGLYGGAGQGLVFRTRGSGDAGGGGVPVANPKLGQGGGASSDQRLSLSGNKELVGGGGLPGFFLQVRGCRGGVEWFRMGGGCL
jgi:hypothetical protein